MKVLAFDDKVLAFTSDLGFGLERKVLAKAKTFPPRSTPRSTWYVYALLTHGTVSQNSPQFLAQEYFTDLHVN